MKRRNHRPLGAGLLALGVLLGACESPSEPPRQVLGSIEAHAGQETQTAQAGAAVPVAPVVRVLDTRGRPMIGVSVQFVVTRGGGTLGKAVARTDAEGLASAVEWKLGAAGLNQVEGRLGTLPAVVFSASATPVPPPEPPVAPGVPFHVDVRVVGSLTARQQQAVSSAVARWQSVITTDAPDVRLELAAGTCFRTQPAVNALVDDLVLFVEFVAIDGVGSVLGEAGPCYVRSESGLPIVGHLKLDAADLARMETNGTLDDVVLHEIGHVLGIGTLWEHLGLVRDAGGLDPRFTGPHAIQAYRSLGGLYADVAVENEGGAGTRDRHWREAEFGSELMTGYVGRAPNPLSALTIASLQDVGYGANALTASQYTLRTSFGSAAAMAAPPERMRERLKKPRFRVDRRGRRESIS